MKNFTSFAREDGSLAPLVFGLFLLTLLTSAIVVDYSSVILKQRILVQHNERALQRAAHSINLGAYYIDGLDQFSVLDSSEQTRSVKYRVPLDCRKALAVYRDEIVNSLITSELERIHTPDEDTNSWRIDSFSCDGSTVRGKISQITSLPFQLPLLGIFQTTIHASASAFSQTIQ